MVEMSNGIVIDVSWEPEHDPYGEYYIHVYRGEWEDTVVDPFTVKHVDEVIQSVELLASSFVNSPVQYKSTSSNTVHEYTCVGS